MTRSDLSGRSGHVFTRGLIRGVEAWRPANRRTVGITSLFSRSQDGRWNVEHLCGRVRGERYNFRNCSQTTLSSSSQSGLATPQGESSSPGKLLLALTTDGLIQSVKQQTSDKPSKLHFSLISFGQVSNSQSEEN